MAWQVLHGKKEKKELLTDLTVPVGSTATIWVPARSPEDVTENGRKIEQSGIITFSRLENGYAIYNVGSGKFSFRSVVEQ